MADVAMAAKICKEPISVHVQRDLNWKQRKRTARVRQQPNNNQKTAHRKIRHCTLWEGNKTFLIAEILNSRLEHGTWQSRTLLQLLYYSLLCFNLCITLCSTWLRLQPGSTVAHYGGPQLSRQIQITHIKYKLLTSNTKSWHQIQITHIKNKLLTSNTNYSHQIQNPDIKHKLLTSNTNCSHQIQITHIKYKLLTSNTNYSYQIQNSDIKNKIKRSALISHLTLICETLIL